MPAWLISLLIGIVINIAGYALLASQNKVQPREVRDMDAPTSEAGRPIAVIWGSGSIAGMNLIGAWDKESIKREAAVEGDKK